MIVGVFLSIGLPADAHAQQRISCESRDYQQNYCGTGSRITGAWLIYQRSVSPCIQGRSWGYDRRGDLGQQRLRGRVRGSEHRGRGAILSRAKAAITVKTTAGAVAASRAHGWSSSARNRHASKAAAGASTAAAFGSTMAAAASSPSKAVADRRLRRHAATRSGVKAVTIGTTSAASAPASAMRGSSNQQSQSPCVEGRSWGSQGSGIWVSQGCAGVFSVRSPLARRVTPNLTPGCHAAGRFQ